MDLPRTSTTRALNLRRRTTMRVWRPALLASMTLCALPGVAAAASDADAARDQAIRDLELRREQQDAQRDMAERERRQAEALRGQEESIRRLEEARQRLENSTREVAELSTQLGRDYRTWGAAPATTMPRALLGVGVQNAAGREGALVGTVSPGGAAAEAGIREGDIITRLDALDLARQSDPARALVQQMQQLEPDRKISLEVLREGKKMNFEVTPRSGPTVAPLRIDEVMPRLQLRSRDDDQPHLRRSFGILDERAQVAGINAAFAGMEFATLSERLGSYFGVDSGVLVVRTGAGAPFGLQDGDVILAIDGRAPTSAQHAGRILRSYQPGEKVKLRVQRDRKAIDIDTTAPDGRGSGPG